MLAGGVGGIGPGRGRDQPGHGPRERRAQAEHDENLGDADREDRPREARDVAPSDAREQARHGLERDREQGS